MNPMFTCTDDEISNPIISFYPQYNEPKNKTTDDTKQLVIAIISMESKIRRLEEIMKTRMDVMDAVMKKNIKENKRLNKHIVALHDKIALLAGEDLRRDDS